MFCRKSCNVIKKTGNVRIMESVDPFEFGSGKAISINTHFEEEIHKTAMLPVFVRV